MEPESGTTTQSKAPVRTRNSLAQKKWVCGGRAIVFAGAALAAEASGLLLDQAQAFPAWRHRGHQFWPTLQATAHFQPVPGVTLARVSDDASAEGHSRTAKTQGPETINDAAVFVSAVSGSRTNALARREELANRGVMLPPMPSPSAAHEFHSEALLSDLAASSHCADATSAVAALVTCDPVTVSTSDAKATGTLEVSVALLPLDAQKASRLPSAGLESFAPVRYEIDDTFALASTLVPLGAQISPTTVSELMGDADVSGQAEGFSFDADATVGFESNPFLFDSPDTGTAALRLSLSPTFFRQGARGDVRAGARIEHIEYTGDYDAVQNVGGDLRSRLLLDERLEGNVYLSFDSGVFVTDLAGLGPVNGTPGEVGGLPGGGDITLLGLDQRRTQYQVGGGLHHQVSERDELELSMSFRADRFGGDILQDSDFLTGRMSYARQVSSGLTIGIAVDASRIDFGEQSVGEVSTISPQAIVRVALLPTWELTGNLGIASIRSDTEFSEETDTDFTGDVSICHIGARSNLCLTGARQVAPFATGGAGLQSTVGASYSFRLSERETFSWSASYSTASGAIAPDGGEVDTISASLGYQLELTGRLRLSADARYTDLRVDLGPSLSNFQALVGLTATVGRAR